LPDVPFRRLYKIKAAKAAQTGVYPLFMGYLCTSGALCRKEAILGRFCGYLCWLWRFYYVVGLYVRFGAVSDADVNFIGLNSVQKTSFCKADVKQCSRFVFVLLTQLCALSHYICGCCSVFCLSLFVFPFICPEILSCLARSIALLFVLP
jgi:hypothetical protein